MSDSTRIPLHYIFALGLAVHVVPGIVLAQDSSPAPTVVEPASAEAVRSEWDLVLQERWRVQVHRTRIYGLLAATGGILSLAGTIGVARTVCIGCSDNETATVWATIGVIGAGVFIVGAIGLLTSGLRRRRIAIQRRELNFDAALQTRRDSFGASVVLQGVW